MPYTNIQWIKLEKRLLNDHRFFLLSEKAQLYYIKLLLLCAITNNKVPRKYEILRQLLRTECSEEELDKIFEEIKNHFPKVLFHKDFYYIKGFKEKHNYIAQKELPGNSEGTPMEVADKIRIEQINKIREEYITLKGLDLKNFYPDDFARTAKAIKNLVFKAGGRDALVVEGLHWIAKQSYEWSLETLVKKWAEFMKCNTPKAQPKPKPTCDVCGGSGYVMQGDKKAKCFCW